MYAVIRTGAKQYRVQPGDVVEVELLDGEKGKEIALTFYWWLTATKCRSASPTSKVRA